MNIKKLLSVFAVLILSITLFSSNVSAIGREPANINVENTDESDSHIIEGVPYVGTETGFDCEYASFAMLYQYLGIDYSYHDLFFLNGGAYTLASRPKNTGLNQYSDNHYKLWPWAPPFSPYVDAGTYVSFWEQDFAFISNLMGLDYTLTYQDEYIGEDLAWGEYWNRCKSYIKQDIPVWTGIDGCCIPWWREHMPRTQEFYDQGLPGAIQHIIVLVGYNETNGTVCYNDMVDANISKFGYEYTGAEDETGEYLWMDLSSLKEGTCKGCPYYWQKYCITLVLEENESKPPKPKAEAFQLARERGIKKLKGYSEEAYDENYTTFYKEFGIDAINEFKKDLKPIKLIPKIILWRIVKKVAKSLSVFHQLKDGLFLVSKDKQFASEVLLENINLHSFCEYDGLLLYSESEKWYELYNLTIDLDKSFQEESFLGNMIKSFTYSIKTGKIVNEIIEIQNSYLTFT